MSENPPETRLTKSDAQRLLDTSPAVHYIAAASAEYPARFVSQGVTAQLGYSPAQFTEDPAFWLSHIHPDDRLRVLDELVRRTDDDLQVHEYRFRHADGSWRWMHDQHRVLRDLDGNILEYVGSWLDITDRKRAEDELQSLHDELEQRVAARTAELAEKERRIRAIMNTAAEAIITIDDRGRIEEFNAAAEQMFGYAPDDALGKSIKLLIVSPHGEDYPSRLLRDPVAAEKWLIGKTGEFLGQRRDGSTFAIEWSANRIGDRNAFTVIMRDVSERKMLQRKIVEDSLRRQRRIGEELHDGVQQDLIGLGFLAQRLTEALQQTCDSNHRLAARLSQGLSEANQKVRALARGLVPVPVDANGLMVALRQLIENVEATSELACTFDCPDPVAVQDDQIATHLFRIAQEAVTNTVKHARATRLCVSLKKTAGNIELEIRDDGVGIDENAKATSGLGLRIIENRCELIAADLRIGVARSGGTVVACKLRAE
jgi:PAS domain S-box-containing protein